MTAMKIINSHRLIKKPDTFEKPITHERLNQNKGCLGAINVVLT